MITRSTWYTSFLHRTTRSEHCQSEVCVGVGGDTTAGGHGSTGIEGVAGAELRIGSEVRFAVSSRWSSVGLFFLNSSLGTCIELPEKVFLCFGRWGH